MKTLRILTVDDEPLALRRLKLLLRRIGHIEHVGQATSCEDALAKVARLAPDVILLDVQMRDGDGFDVVRRLARRQILPAIIFITAIDHYAVQAFDAAAADYLLKPVELSRLKHALSRAREHFEIINAKRRPTAWIGRGIGS